MKLIEIINKIDCKVIGSKNKKVEHLSNMAQDCKKNSVFFCLNGKNNNGADFSNIAIENGCRIIVCEQSVTTNKRVTQLIVPDARKAMSKIASVFYGDPATKLKIIGVTGTNGKTTTTNMIAHVLKSQYKVGLIGTNGVIYNDKIIQTGLTTPDPIMLYKLLADMLSQGVEYVVMEYSAHAIYLQKLWGITTDIVAFTNLSQDHLDYFENMEKYYNAKKALFTNSEYNHAVVCIDTDYGKQLAKVAKNCITCSSNKTDADIFVLNKEHTTINQTFSVCTKSGSAKINLSMLGKFNIQNAVVAISACLKCGLNFDQIATRLSSLNGVDGRFECFSNQRNTVIVDYAHTPDGLANVLETAVDVAEKNRVISVFGCGGNRDAEKRPLMGEISERLADFTIITTDNPRFEDNYKIALDIAKGFTKNKWKIVLDRGQAIREALEMCKNGDIVVLAGKGAETYTEINGTKVDSSDKELVKRVLGID